MATTAERMVGCGGVLRLVSGGYTVNWIYPSSGVLVALFIPCTYTDMGTPGRVWECQPRAPELSTLRRRK
jgi:hypothetical protein